MEKPLAFSPTNNRPSKSDGKYRRNGECLGGHDEISMKRQRSALRGFVKSRQDIRRAFHDQQNNSADDPEHNQSINQ
jgi:hypothetical protein